jgi:SAM-dependent methyltransferase
VADSQRDLFDHVAEGYDEAIPFFRNVGRDLVAFAGLEPGMRILDIGAGRGAVASAVAEATGGSCSVVAGDISERKLKELAALELPGVQTAVVDATALGLPDGSFDAVLGGFVCHILPAPSAALAEVARVLRPGGSFTFSVPGPSADGGWWASYGSIVETFSAKVAGATPNGMTHEPMSWQRRAERAGLRLLEQRDVEVSLPIEGPSAHWEWLLSHGNRWLYDALAEPDREEFARQVLCSLVREHPAHGTRLVAGATIYRLTTSSLIQNSAP